MGFTPPRSVPLILRGLFSLIYDHDIGRRLGGFELQTKLLLECLEDVGLSRIRQLRQGTKARELELVGHPIEHKVKSAFNVCLIDYRAIQHGGLHDLSEIRHGRVPSWKHTRPGKDEIRKILPRCGLRHFVLCVGGQRDGINRELSLFVMKFQLKPVGHCLLQ